MFNRPNLTELKPTILENSFIWSPIPNHEYQIQYQQKEISIYFYGNVNFKYFDFGSGIGKTFKNGIAQARYFISKEFLPKCYRISSLPPIMFINNDECRADQLKTLLIPNCIEIAYHFDKSSFNLKVDASTHFIKPLNEKLQQDYQKSLPKIPIIAGKYPIFLDENKPHFSYLENLYKNILRCNKDDQLKLQYQNSEDCCHIRAHALYHFLSLPAVKVYKFWDFYDWKNYAVDKSWYFHCAIMFIDQDNQGWVCDPWVGFNKTLLTLNEWAFRKDEPTPKKIMITNPAVIDDIAEGEEATASHFMKTSPKRMIDAFLAIATSFFPNSPEKPLSNSVNDFLQNRTRIFRRNALCYKNHKGLFKSNPDKKTKESCAKTYRLCAVL